MKKNVLFLVITMATLFCLQEALSKIDPKKVLSKDEYNLYKSAYLGRTGKVKNLVKNGVNVNVQSPNSQRTPLHIAVSKGRFDIVKELVENGGANLEIKNIAGKTSLHFAVENGKHDIIQYLVQKGAKVTDEIKNGTNKEEVKKILENNGNMHTQ